MLPETIGSTCLQPYLVLTETKHLQHHQIQLTIPKVCVLHVRLMPYIAGPFVDMPFSTDKKPKE